MCSRFRTIGSVIHGNAKDKHRLVGNTRVGLPNLDNMLTPTFFARVASGSITERLNTGEVYICCGLSCICSLLLHFQHEMTVLEDFVHTCVARLGFKDKTLPPALERPARQIAHKWGETEGQLRCPELEKECNSVIDTLGCSIWSRGQSRSTDLVEDIDSRSLYQEHLYFEDQDHRRQ